MVYCRMYMEKRNSPQRRVLIVTEVYRPGVGGVQEAIDTLVDGLREAGDEVVIVTGSPRLTTRLYIEKLDNGATVYRLPAVASPVNPTNNRITFLPQIWMHALWRQQARFDVIHMHTPSSWLMTSIAKYAERNHVPYIVTNHVMNLNLNMNKTGWFFRKVLTIYERQAVRLMNSASMVTAPTRNALKMMQHIDVPMTAISNGLDTNYYSPGKVDKTIAAKFMIDLESARMIYTGRLDGEKRVDILIDAMPKLLKEHPNIQLVIIGKGLLDKELRQRAADHQLGDRIIFCGYVTNDEKRGLLRMSDIFVNASPAELQCISALEALACGVPLVVADQVALPELTNDTKNGLIFAYPSVDDLVHTLDELIADPKRRKQMAQAGRAWVCKHHDYAKTVQQYRDVYSAAQN